MFFRKSEAAGKIVYAQKKLLNKTFKRLTNAAIQSILSDALRL